MCGVVWCKSRQILAKSNTFLLFLPRETKKTYYMTNYMPPSIEIIEFESETPILSMSTDKFNNQDSYDGDWI